MAEVIINNPAQFERALQIFKAQCKQEGIVKACKERQYYTKPSQVRREERKSGINKMLKAAKPLTGKFEKTSKTNKMGKFNKPGRKF